MNADVRAVLWLLGAVVAVVGAALYAWPLGVATLGAVLMWRAR